MPDFRNSKRSASNMNTLTAKFPQTLTVGASPASTEPQPLAGRLFVVGGPNSNAGGSVEQLAQATSATEITGPATIPETPLPARIWSVLHAQSTSQAPFAAVPVPPSAANLPEAAKPLAFLSGAR